MAETSVQEIQRQEIARLFGGFARYRAMVLPLPMAAVCFILFTDPSWWRRGLVSLVLIAAPLLSIVELRRFRRSGMESIRAANTMLIAGCGVLLMIAGTGGLESPFAFTTVPMAIVITMLMPKRLPRIAFLSLQLLTLWTLTAIALTGRLPHLIPLVFGGGPRAGHNDALLLMQAGLFSLGLISGNLMVPEIRRRFETIIRRARENRDEALRVHAEQAQLLTALSAEIAHELKNPLASVKGLAALMAADQQGKNAERLTVLRREVDRMHTILDEFLNFSRPLGPLARQPANLVELCHAVVDLHEGLCAQARLSMRVHALGEVTAPCDARKVKQILINLLQNAIEASAPGGDIEIEVAKGPRIRVLDRGGGLPPSLAVFEAGATTKPTGSGLGLTVARALARQHGGELSLTDRPGGGCVAELTFPA